MEIDKDACIMEKIMYETQIWFDRIWEEIQKGGDLEHPKNKNEIECPEEIIESQIIKKKLKLKCYLSYDINNNLIIYLPYSIIRNELPLTCRINIKKVCHKNKRRICLFFMLKRSSDYKSLYHRFKIVNCSGILFLELLLNPEYTYDTISKVGEVKGDLLLLEKEGLFILETGDEE
ncbi:hypothetical protein COY27_06405 [Candidatus Woesearchaeota archaeon CG_4_10_14_0_2_um_filter_33_13]|nr:MAG: hypothetical protein COY27_06405 [Candidatus Woesearchaeota archaeon CG_4_10_14_0_2_um_filter_33_13]